MGLRPIIFDVLDGSKGQIVLSTKVQKKNLSPRVWRHQNLKGCAMKVDPSLEKK